MSKIKRKKKRQKKDITIYINRKADFIIGLSFENLLLRLSDPSILDKFKEGEPYDNQHLLFFLAYIQYRYLILCSDIDASANEIRISSTYIQNDLRIPKAIHYYNILYDLGILDTRVSYKEDEAPFGYSFTEQYRDCRELAPTTVHHFPAFSNESLEKKYKHLDKWLVAEQIKTEDFTGRLTEVRRNKLETLNSQYASLRNFFKDNALTLSLAEKLFQERKTSINTSFSSQQLLLSFIQLGYIRKSVDKTSSRLHTNITNLKKDFRKLLRYQNEDKQRSFVGVDIKNSQPYMSLILFDERFYRLLLGEKFSKKEFFLGQPYFKDTRERLKEVLDTEFLDTFRSKLQAPDVLKYIELVSSGEFYDEMLEKHGKDILVKRKKETESKLATVTKEKIRKYFGELSDLKPSQRNRRIEERKNMIPNFDDLLTLASGKEAERADMKEMMFLTFFSKNGFKGDMVGAYPKKSFEKEFPTVCELFEKIKSGNYYKGKKNVGHNLLAVLLQQIESYLILLVVTKDTARNRNQKLPMYTIHDSILTIEGEHTYVFSMMGKVFCEHIGTPPRLAYEPEQNEENRIDTEQKTSYLK